jgi:hypothetical protein
MALTSNKTEKILFMNIGQSRGDDLESYFYLLMFLLHGELPWKQRYRSSLSFNEVRNMKNQYTPEELWPGIPSTCLKILMGLSRVV